MCLIEHRRTQSRMLLPTFLSYWRTYRHILIILSRAYTHRPNAHKRWTNENVQNCRKICTVAAPAVEWSRRCRANLYFYSSFVFFFLFFSSDFPLPSSFRVILSGESSPYPNVQCTVYLPTIHRHPYSTIDGSANAQSVNSSVTICTNYSLTQLLKFSIY